MSQDKIQRGRHGGAVALSSRIISLSGRNASSECIARVYVHPLCCSVLCCSVCVCVKRRGGRLMHACSDGAVGDVGWAAGLNVFLC